MNSSLSEQVCAQSPSLNVSNVDQPIESTSTSGIGGLSAAQICPISSDNIDDLQSPEELTTAENNDESIIQETQDAQLNSSLTGDSPSLNVSNVDQPIGSTSTSRIDQLSAPQISPSSIVVQSAEVNNISTI